MKTANIFRPLARLFLVAIIGSCASCTPDNQSPTESNLEAVERDEQSQSSTSQSSTASSQLDLSTEQSSDPVLFDQVTPAGLDSAVYRNGEEAGVSSILESLGGGIGIHDFDLDGFPDVIVPGGGTFLEGDQVAGLSNYFLRGLDDFKFTDESSRAQMASSKFYTHGVAIADYDNDGFPDILLTGYGGLQLLRNQGDGTFADQTSMAGLFDDRWSTSASWGDMNNDGNLDLYVCHYVNWSFSHHPF
ncbi:MAG: VCBS repeat-containing protein, partial [Aureliella sp.]